MADDQVLNRILASSATYYQILDVSIESTREEIRRAYKKLALQLHPDKYRGARKEDAARAFLLVADACETLSNDATRTAYDSTLRQERQGDSSTSRTFDPHPDWSVEKKVVYAFWMFMDQVERDLQSEMNAEDAASGVAVLGALAAIKEGSAVLTSNPIILCLVLAFAALYGLATTSQQRQTHLTDASNALNWNNWEVDTKILVVRLLKSYYKTQFESIR